MNRMYHGQNAIEQNASARRFASRMFAPTAGSDIPGDLQRNATRKAVVPIINRSHVVNTNC